MVVRLALALVLFSFLFSCREDIDQFIPLNDAPPRYVSASLLGKVWSADGATLEGAQVSLHGNQTLTDAEGFFFFPAAQAPESGALLEVRKEGYFPGFRRLYWTAQSQLQTDILLFSKVLTGVLPVETGGELECNGGMRIAVPEEAFEYSDGVPAAGMARVYAYWLDPSDPAFPEWLPGGAQGENEAGDLQYLQSYGILAIDMTDENGLPLRLAAGKKMELHFPVPLSFQPGAPQKISLWALDTEAGVWKESSLAYLANNTYQAEAASGQFWNAAAARPLVQVKSWVRHADGSPALDVLVHALGSDGQKLAASRTQNQGLFTLGLPAGMETTLRLFDLCGEERHSQEIPALTGNVSLTPITWPQNDAVEVEGRLLDCNGNPVDKGYVQILLGEREILLPLTGGAFSASLPACPGTSGALIAHDLVRNFQTPPVSFSASAPAILGDVVLCNDAPEYLSFNLDGEVHFSDSPEISVAGGVTTISDAGLGVSVSFEGASTGSYPVLLQGFSMADLSASNITGLDLVFSISRFDPPGGFVIGSFHGKAVDQEGEDRAISGVFKVGRM